MINEFYNIKLKHLNIKHRIVLEEDLNYFIYGIGGVGKSFIAYEYIKNSKKNHLYIDINNYKIKKLNLYDEITSFIKEKVVDILILDNFTKQYKDIINIPIKQIIAISDKIIPLKNFNNIEIFPLSYIEFKILFDSKITLNHFIRGGNIFNNFKDNFNFKDKNSINLLKLKLSANQFMILQEIVVFQSTAITLHQLYLHIKNENKISKDTFYRDIKILEELKYIYLIQKYNNKNSARKLYLFDFSLKDSFGYINFFKLFENMVFNEIIRKNKNIYYEDNNTLYIKDDNTFMIIIPFLEQINIINYIDKLKPKIEEYKVQNVKVISMSMSDIFIYEEVEVEIITFIQLSDVWSNK